MIKTYLKHIVFIMMGLFLQSTMNKAGLYVPDLLLMLVISLAFSSQNVVGLVSAFFLGLLSDLASGVYIGPFAAAYVCTFCFAGMISKRVFADRLFAIMGVTFFACIVKSLVFCAFILYFVPSISGTLINPQILIFEAILTALISPLVFRIFIGKFFGKPKSRSGSTLTFSRAAK